MLKHGTVGSQRMCITVRKPPPLEKGELFCSIPTPVKLYCLTDFNGLTIIFLIAEICSKCTTEVQLFWVCFSVKINND